MSNQEDTLHLLRTKAVEDFLKAMHYLNSRNERITLEHAAEELGIPAEKAQKIANQLAEHQFVEIQDDTVLVFTTAGQRLALELSLRTEAVEDFLKIVYLLQRKHDPVPTSALAAELGIKPPSVTEMAKKLADYDLLEYEKYKGIRLTVPGRRIALEVVRHHRLLELYLMQALDYTWDEVHEEADRLEHVISEQFENRIAAALGNPKTDPHGDPIPALDGTLPTQEMISLADLPLGDAFIVCRITDQSSDALQYFETLGLVPGAKVIATAYDPFDGPARILVEDNEVIIGIAMARSVMLTPMPALHTE